REAAGGVHVGELDVELEPDFHGADAEPGYHLEVTIIDSLDRLDARCHRGDELVVQESLPHDVRWSGDLGPNGKVEAHMRGVLICPRGRPSQRDETGAVSRPPRPAQNRKLRPVKTWS